MLESHLCDSFNWNWIIFKSHISLTKFYSVYWRQTWWAHQTSHLSCLTVAPVAHRDLLVIILLLNLRVLGPCALPSRPPAFINGMTQAARGWHGISASTPWPKHTLYKNMICSHDNHFYCQYVSMQHMDKIFNAAKWTLSVCYEVSVFKLEADVGDGLGVYRVVRVGEITDNSESPTL